MPELQWPDTVIESDSDGFSNTETIVSSFVNYLQSDGCDYNILLNLTRIINIVSINFLGLHK